MQDVIRDRSLTIRDESDLSNIYLQLYFQVYVEYSDEIFYSNKIGNGSDGP